MVTSASAAPPVEATATLDKNRIVVETSAPHHPLWLKVSYHPDWRISEGAGELYLASPAFMLLVPETSRVVLRFDTSGGFYENPYKIYGCLLTRVKAAKLTHGIRGVLWHQGENDSGSGAPTGDWNYKSYQQYFVEMSAAWKQDYPNIQHYYVFQVWPLS